ncbi:rCG36923, isoform CRA_c [Rattus norvegicus]|uniref:RCG36923, isoform CRA_c n=1 Tax=Rattus norvegicus TaxID=10116 RepID=A6HU33_RAT|nr:rCG36923, isoform CRA_c [Rattus norvegicus]
MLYSAFSCMKLFVYLNCITPPPFQFIIFSICRCKILNVEDFIK